MIAAARHAPGAINRCSGKVTAQSRTAHVLVISHFNVRTNAPRKQNDGFGSWR